MHRGWQALLVVSTLLASWLGMQATHELGHVMGALLTGGEVENVALHPLGISRTDLGENPQPLVVVWSGPVLGVLLPLLTYALARGAIRTVLRFFAGFCLIANGAYIGLGSFEQIGDCHELLNHGALAWQLWLFGAVTIPTGFYLWNGLGPEFGMGRDAQAVSSRLAAAVTLVALLLVGWGWWVGN